jgi:hypothetical protein
VDFGNDFKSINMKEIRLVNGKGIVLVDNEDFDRLSTYRWHAQTHKGRTMYATTSIKNPITGKWRNVAMHRLILGITDPRVFVDHKNGCGTDNQRHNIRVCTPGQNQHNRKVSRNNTSGYKGVYKNHDKWQAEIAKDGQQIYIGSFTCPAEAARAYNAKALELHGEFARLNPV